MFHEGDLQSGISLAISQQRTVVCFVRDDGEESTTWEEQWLNESTVSQALASKAVVLRIQAGSQEAGFLAAFCSIDKTPSLILIHNGQLKDNIVAGAVQDDFSKRVLAAVGEGAPGSATATDALPSDSENAQQTPIAASGDNTENQASRDHLPTTEASSTNTTASPPALQRSASSASQQSASPPPLPSDSSHPPSYSTANLQSTFPDRAAQLEATHRQQQEADQAKAAAARARQDAGQSSGKPKTARNDYAAQQRQRLAEAKKERERIMAQIEADKIARKQREKERKEAEQATMSKLAAEQPIPADPSRPTRRAGAAANANIQVRLFSGGTLRHTFPATAALDPDVRAWVDDAAAQDAQAARPPPYVFKHILNPLPSRTLEVGEEHRSLADLDMLPSATLALVPVQGAVVDAFGAGAAASGVLGYAYGAASGAVGLVGGAVGWGASTLGSIVGLGGRRGESGDAAASSRPAGAADEGSQGASQTPATDGANERDEGRSKARVRTLADGRADEAKDKPETWYNGNQTSYQPKDDPGEGPS